MFEVLFKSLASSDFTRFHAFTRVDGHLLVAPTKSTFLFHLLKFFICDDVITLEQRSRSVTGNVHDGGIVVAGKP